MPALRSVNEAFQYQGVNYDTYQPNLDGTRRLPP
jgi:hypothetical protein